MEFKGTKGNWEYSSDNGWQCNVLTDNDQQVIQLENTDSETDEGFYEMYANAKLISASPDMLKALQFSLKVLLRDKNPIFSKRLAIKYCEESIEKALGNG